MRMELTCSVNVKNIPKRKRLILCRDCIIAEEDRYYVHKGMSEKELVWGLGKEKNTKIDIWRYNGRVPCLKVCPYCKGSFSKTHIEEVHGEDVLQVYALKVRKEMNNLLKQYRLVGNWRAVYCSLLSYAGCKDAMYNHPICIFSICLDIKGLIPDWKEGFWRYGFILV